MLEKSTFNVQKRTHMQVLISVVAMEMQMSHKHDNGANEYFQINLVPIDQSIKKLKIHSKTSPPPPTS